MNPRLHEKPADNTTIVCLSEVEKHYGTGTSRFVALEEIDLEFKKGQLVCLTGASGSGKSTLLNLIAGLDRVSAGRIEVAGEEISTCGESELSVFRGRSVGVVFQFFQLLPTLTVLENLLLPMELVDRIPKAERKVRALALLEEFGVVDQSAKFPSALSGGQQQRVAIARALANNPPLVVLDEPTGNLDSRSADLVFEMLFRLSRAGKTVLVASHAREFPITFDRIVTIADGRVVATNTDGAAQRSARIS